MTHSANLTSKGQVTVPVSIRRRLGLKPGEPVRFRLTSTNQVVIEKNDWREDLNTLHQEVAVQLKKKKVRTLTSEELDQEIDQAGSAAVTKEWQQNQGRS